MSNKYILLKLLALFVTMSSVNFAMDTEQEDATEDSDTTSEESDFEFLVKDFQDIRRVGRKTIEICPPNKCFVLGVGQSPTAIIAYLQTEHSNYAKSIPLTGFRYGVGFPELTEKQKARLHDHFSYNLPNERKLGHRTIMLMDFASHNGGHSVLATLRHLEEYLRAEGRPNKVEILAFKDNENLERVPYRFNHIFVFDRNNQFIQNLDHNVYKVFSPFGEFYIEDFAREALTRERPAYRLLKQRIEILKKESQQQIFTHLPFSWYTQSGTLKTWTELDLTKSRQIQWYANQLTYYQGEDLLLRFHQMLTHQGGRQMLIEIWQEFKTLPLLQNELLQIMLKSETLKYRWEIINNIRSVASELKKQCICLLFNLNEPAITKELVRETPKECATEFVDIFKELKRNSHSLVADQMLDDFLLPEFRIEIDNFDELKEIVVGRFQDLLNDPETRAIATQQYQRYLLEKTDLPKMSIFIHDADDAMAPGHRFSLGAEHHQVLRASLFKKLKELLEENAVNMVIDPNN
jgi:hypothetical protein